MKWPFKHRAVPDSDTPFFNLLYLCARDSGAPDSTIVWTSEIPWQPTQEYIQEYKSRHSRFINTSHVLVQAVGHGLAEHPILNRRVVGRRVHEFKDRHVSLATRVPGNDEVFVIQIHNPDSRPLHEIAYIIMMRQLGLARSDAPECRDLERLRKLPNWLTRCTLRFADWMDKKFVIPVVGRIDRFRESGVLVNDFSSKRFPIMRGYKPSRQPGESKPLSVTLGPPEDKVVWKDGAATVEKVAPITVRVDHRICDSFNLSQFLKTIIEKMTHPSMMEPAIDESSSAKRPITKPTSPALPRLSA